MPPTPATPPPVPSNTQAHERGSGTSTPWKSRKTFFSNLHLPSPARVTSASLSPPRANSPGGFTSGESSKRRFSFLSSSPLHHQPDHLEAPNREDAASTRTRDSLSASVKSIRRIASQLVRLPTSPIRRRAMRSSKTVEAAPAGSLSSASSIPSSSADASFTSTSFTFDRRRPSTDSSASASSGSPIAWRAPHEWQSGPLDGQRKSLDAFLFPSLNRRGEQHPALFRSTSSGDLRALAADVSRPYSPAFPFPRMATKSANSAQSAPLQPQPYPSPRPNLNIAVVPAPRAIHRLPSDVRQCLGGSPSLPCLRIHQLHRVSLVSFTHSDAASYDSASPLPSPKTLLHHRTSTSTVSSLPLHLDIQGPYLLDQLSRPYLCSRFSDATPSPNSTPTSILSVEDLAGGASAKGEEDLESGGKDTISQRMEDSSDKAARLAPHESHESTFGRAVAEKQRSSMEEAERWIEAKLSEQAKMLKELGA